MLLPSKYRRAINLMNEKNDEAFGKNNEVNNANEQKSKDLTAVADLEKSSESETGNTPKEDSQIFRISDAERQAMRKKQRKEDRVENIKNFFSALIAAFIILLPVLLLIVAAISFFILKFFRVI